MSLPFRALLRTLRGLHSLTLEARGIKENLARIADVLGGQVYFQDGSPEGAIVFDVSDEEAYRRESAIREKEAEIGRELLPHEIERLMRRMNES